MNGHASNRVRERTLLRDRRKDVSESRSLMQSPVVVLSRSMQAHGQNELMNR